MGERIVCLLIGYIFGLFQTGYFVGLSRHRDIRNYGSGNSGTTNALRVFGKRAGAIVFLGDILKALLACLLAGWGAVHFGYGDERMLLMLYAGLGTVLGHNFPFYLQFRGGKGIAASWGIALALDWRMALACMAVFIAVTAVTRYVSLASLSALAVFAVMWFIFGGIGELALAGIRPEADILVIVIVALGYVRHHGNIRRLLSGTENKIGQRVKLPEQEEK